jgi:carbon-monoxide dehydrogenase large subunit
MAVTEDRRTYIGQVVARKEDARLLTGQAKFIDDLTLPATAWASIVRSPYPHARIVGMDVSEARTAWSPSSPAPS